ncbi:MAG: CheB methylesterase domain-containing protein [Alkalispirochaeta sp.]
MEHVTSLRVAVRSVSSLFATLLGRGLALHPEVTVIETGLLTKEVPSAWSESSLTGTDAGSEYSLTTSDTGAGTDGVTDRSEGTDSASGTATGGDTHSPNVIILDFDIDRSQDVLAATTLRSRVSCPILVLAPRVDPKNTTRLRARGFPVVRRRPDLNQLTHADRVDPLYQLLRATIRGAGAPVATEAVPQRPAVPVHAPAAPGTPAKILLVIGASTGGPPAVRQVLRDIPNQGSWAIAVVQHITPSFAAGFARWIDESTHHSARLAEHQMSISTGTVVVAPGDTHLRVAGGRYVLDSGEKRLFQRPSADNLFESAAEAFGSRTVGVLLTGMGRDGGAGCCAIMQAGGVTVAQDQESSTVYGMPRAAVELGCATQELPLARIGGAVTELLTRIERNLRLR